MATVRELRSLLYKHPMAAFTIHFKDGRYTSGRVNSQNEKEISIKYDPLIDQLQLDLKQDSTYYSLRSIYPKNTIRLQWKDIHSIQLFFKEST